MLITRGGEGARNCFRTEGVLFGEARKYRAILCGYPDFVSDPDHDGELNFEWEAPPNLHELAHGLGMVDEKSPLHSKCAMFVDLQVLRAALMVLCAVALAFVTWRFILPLVAMYSAGVGVAIPLPKRFVQSYAKLAIWVFVVGGPLLFFAIVAAFIWLLRPRMMPR